MAPNVHSDAELLDLLRDGDHAAFTVIYRRYFKLLYLHALKKTGDEAQAEDVVQELFTILWQKRAEINSTHLAAYLYTSIRNRIVDMYAKQQVADKYIRTLGDFADAYHENADHLVRERDLTAIIEKEIQAMPPRMREIFELSRKAHLSHQEIAEQLDISPNTVSVQLTKALHLLRVKLGIFSFILLILNS
jgi:RNA polymerase sigma-70 factor (ECF subfamily)